MPHVGIIGLGLLGGALAARLRERGLTVSGYDLRPECRASLTACGGLPLSSAQDVFDTCQTILFSLPTSDHVAELLSSVIVKPGILVIDTTTGDPEAMEGFGELLEQRGAAYCDATIAGSSQEARQGEVLVMLGGSPGATLRAQEILQHTARQIVHVGPCGSGARMKLVVNLVLGLNRAVLAEGLSFARSLGLAPEAALAILNSGPAQSRVMTTKGPKMLAGEFQPVARLAQHLKDVQLILQQGRRHAARLPLSQLHLQLLESLVARGYADEDNAAVIRAFQPDS